MATYGDVRDESCRRFERVMKTWIVCFGTFSLSMVGGLMLAWWAFYYHRTNNQLWMVPIGLVLCGTPLTVWLSVFISDICAPCPNSPDCLPEKSYGDPER